MIKAKKSLGQNFLIDKNIINKITDLIDIENKSILEVGPGSGNLTSSLLKKKPKKFFAVEKDNSLAFKLKEKFNDQINLIIDDVLNIDESSLSNEQLISSKSVKDAIKKYKIDTKRAFPSKL